MKQIDNLEATEKAISKYPVLSDLIGHFILSGMIAKLTALEEFYRRAKELEARSLAPSGAVVEAGISDRELKERAPKTNLNVSESEFIEKFNQLSDRYNAALSSPSVEPTVEEQVEEIMGVIVEEVFEYWNDKATLRQRLIKHLTK